MSKKKTIKTALVSKVAVAYARYSSNNQREESIDAQLRAIREYCERENIVLLECYVDEALTGQNDDRAGFQRMLEDVFRGHIKVDTVLVHKFNRFARNKFDSALYKKRLKDVGVRVISVTQPIDDSPEGAMLESIIEAMDEYYSANLALEVKKGLRENALQGKRPGGKAAFGLTVTKDGHYAPGKDAWIVKRIFEEYASGVPLATVVAQLNKEGLRNAHGRSFSIRTVFDMLRNEKYIGNFIYKLGNETIRLDGIIEPIIDKELWARVQKICNQPLKARMRHQKAQYYLTGKTYCGECGMPICGAGSKRMRDGSLYYYYKCVGKTAHKNGCKNPGLNKEWYEKTVLKATVDAVMNEEKLREIARLAFEELQTAQQSPAEKLGALQKELASLNSQQKRLADLYLIGTFDIDELNAKNKDFAARKVEIELEIEKQNAAMLHDNVTEDDIYNYVSNYIEKLKTGSTSSDEFMRSVFNTFVEKVIVYHDTITVLLNADFSSFNGGDDGENGGGDKRQFTGAFCHLPTYKLEAKIMRKRKIFGRNELTQIIIP